MSNICIQIALDLYLINLIAIMFEDLTSFVIDVGTNSTRLGYGGDDSPKIIVPSYVAKRTTMEDEEKNIVAGSKFLSLDRTDIDIESIFQSKDNKISYSIDPANYQKYIEYLLTQELKINVSDYSLLFSEDVNLKPSEILAQRQIIANIAFQKLQVPNIFFLKSPVLSCFATGRSTATIVDSGENSTRITPVHDGFVLNKNSRVLDFGGKQLNNEFQKYITNQTGKPLQSRFDLKQAPYTQSFLQFQRSQLLQDIKQFCTPSSSNIQQNAESAEKVSYELPDKSVIQIEKNQIKDIFVASQNSDRGPNQMSIPSAVVEAINNSDIDIKRQLYSNILMTGGNFLYNGQTFPNQVLSKISTLAPSNAKIKSVSLCSNSERKYLSWIGGSIVSCLSAFQSYWIGRQEYQASGVNVLEKKCM